MAGHIILLTHNHRPFRLVLHLILLMLVNTFLFSCSQNDINRDKIEVGQTRREVIATAGDPYEIDDFELPSTPFFGPQEGLASLVPAGTTVEEWRYLSVDEVTYVWFAGEGSALRADWTVIDTATYPLDAIF